MLVREKMTYREYAALPNDGKRYELIQGEIEMTPAPSFQHQQYSAELNDTIRQYVKQHTLGIVVYAPLDVILDERNTVQPDIIFVSTLKKGIITERGVEGAPDLVVEIVSPSSATRDRYTKKDLYEKFGVKEYWIADPANKSIEVLVLSAEGCYEPYCAASAEGDEENANRVVRSFVLEGWTADVREIFSASDRV